MRQTVNQIPSRALPNIDVQQPNLKSKIHILFSVRLINGK